MLDFMLVWLLAVASGLLSAAAFPPFDVKQLIWVGLVPLFIAVSRAKSPRQAAGLGYLAGLLFFLLNLHPLVSAHSWTGWAAESQTAFTRRMSHQWWFMQGIWIAFAVWCACWWAGWAFLIKRLGRGSTARMMVLAPSLWILLPEAVRAQTTFGFAWGFFGNALADFPALRQLAALGGVWLLSALVVVVSAGLALMLEQPRRRSHQTAALASAGLLFLGWLFGMSQLRRGVVAAGSVSTAVVQHHKASYHTNDFSTIGLDRNYISLAGKALKSGSSLVVLPESIALGALSLDGTASRTKPAQWQHSRLGWDRQMTGLLAGTSSFLMLGVDTVESGRDHNTLIAWDAKEVLGWYHKRRLVPFAEYQPWPWAPWAIRGQSQYSPGKGSQLIRLPNGLVLGGFICQEVLFPWVVRQSVRDGATVLVTGGNDGVFGDPAVARVHADCAQIRAAETGRYVIRAMKTGISSVIDWRGNELVRSLSAEPLLLTGSVIPRQRQTPYVRFGNWLLWLAAFLVPGLTLFKPFRYSLKESRFWR